MDGMTEQENQTLNEDPGSSLAQWANGSDEWVRRLVRQVLGSSGPVSEHEQALIYQLLLEEKGIDDRTLPTEPPLASPAQPLTQSEPFHLARISNIRGVNALVEGGHIDFGLGLTLLYGENGMGKTGYARILKRMAGSRSAEDILADVNLQDDPPPPSADIDYQLGGTDLFHQWNGEKAQPPFTLMSIFDNPSAHLHVDDDLRYTYRPASLAFFDRVNLEVQNIGELIERDCQSLNFDNSPLLKRFDSGSSIYPYIESLGPATNLQELQQNLTLPDNAAEQEKELENTIAALRANVIGQQVSLKSKFQSVLKEALAYTSVAGKFQSKEYDDAVSRLSNLYGDLATLRDSLFDKAHLPANPDETWDAFIRAGQEYRKHLESLGVHDDTRCLYCRQLLNTDALELIVKYSEYLESKIAKDIEAQESAIQVLVKPLQGSSLTTVQVFSEPVDSDTDVGIPPPAEQVEQIEALRNLLKLDGMLRQDYTDKVPINEDTLSQVSGIGAKVEPWLADVTAELETLRAQDSDREKVLTKKQDELLELKARIELNKSWKEVSGIVAVSSRHDNLRTERTAISNVLRNVTLLSNKASEQLINNNFKEIFRNECAELRAAELEVEFSGREGGAQRKKKLAGGHSPSKVLSEGEQKVLAIADFIAETRMSDNSVPVIFDDPVSSLDHRRIGDVAKRIADLASDHQVIVFTHDILLVTNLLDLFENSEHYAFYWVTDDNGKGTVTPATGVRWDTIGALNARVNSAVDKARKSTGEERDTHIREGYGLIRAWCEVFVEHDVLAEVTERYQPNVRIGALKRIQVSKLEQTIETVTSVFDDACRYIDAHSQPLPFHGVNPKLPDLENDWEKLKKCRNEYNKK